MIDPTLELKAFSTYISGHMYYCHIDLSRPGICWIDCKDVPNLGALSHSGKSSRQRYCHDWKAGVTVNYILPQIVLILNVRILSWG